MRRLRKGRLAPAVALVVALTAPAAAAAEPGDPVIFQFEVRGSNGYEIEFTGDRQNGGEGAQISAADSTGFASYVVRSADNVRADEIAADFGRRGGVDVEFRPTGEVRKRRFRGCDGFDLIEKGVFTGRIRFRGEQGFSTANATRAVGRRTVLGIDFESCFEMGVGDGAGERERGFILGACREDAGLDLIAYKGSRTGRAAFTSFLFEDRGGLSIFRAARVTAPSSTFEPAPGLASASLQPPPPFSGTAALSGDELTGDLAVDLPGAPAQALTPARAKLDRGTSVSPGGSCGAFVVFGSERGPSPVSQRRWSVPGSWPELGG